MEQIEQTVTPFEVHGIANYDRLIRDFGCEPMTHELIERFESLTGVKMPTGYRNFVISHRDFSLILDAHESKKDFYLYTGRGPSSNCMHLGHLVPFRFCKFLQDTFKCRLVIQITDDEKCVFKNLKLEDVQKMAVDNIKDIIAVGFDPDKTLIFQNSQYIHKLYPMMLKIGKLVTLSQIMSSFGFEKDNTCIGKVNFPTVQMAPAFAETFGMDRNVRCLIPCAIDQDPYFRLTRGIAKKLKHPKPAVVHTKFLPGLSGVETKMSASIPSECIFLGDSAKQIRKKINRSFSGGQETLEEHQKLGGNVAKDVAFQLLTFFSENPEELERLSSGFKNGTVSCSDMKKAAADCIIKVIENFKK
jgi:tryptophanyl-tRNA synthetase